jgi:hypothetical protein
VMAGAYHAAAFPEARKRKRTLASTPHAPGLLGRAPAAPLPLVIEPSVPYGVTRQGKRI